MKRNTPFNWRCPYCGCYAAIDFSSYSCNEGKIGTCLSRYGDIGFLLESISCPNPSCREISVKISLTTVEFVNSVRCIHVIGHWHLMPRSKAKPLPSYVPEAIRKDYEEACLILNDSPKASATLARRCLQGIVRDFWDMPKNKRGNLAAELNYLKENIDDETWEMIEAIRQVGNIGAHMEKDVNVIIEVEKEEAEFLIELIESLIDAWYVARHDAEERRKRAVELVQRKKEQKQQAKEKANKDGEGEQ